MDNILSDDPSPDATQNTGGYKTLDNSLEFDIKGNSYKNTLIPEKSAKSAFSRHKNLNNTMYGQSFSNKEPVKPRYKGYVRSGQILFNNIN